jgi:hypothetical protein
LEVVLELCFFAKPLKFGVEAHIEAENQMGAQSLGATGPRFPRHFLFFFFFLSSTKQHKL